MGGMFLKGPKPLDDLLSHPVPRWRVAGAPADRPLVLSRWEGRGEDALPGARRELLPCVYDRGELAPVRGARSVQLVACVRVIYIGMSSAPLMASLNFSIMDPAFPTVTCTSASGLACLAAWRISGKT